MDDTTKHAIDLAERIRDIEDWLEERERATVNLGVSLGGMTSKQEAETVDLKRRLRRVIDGLRSYERAKVNAATRDEPSRRLTRENESEPPAGCAHEWSQPPAHCLRCGSETNPEDEPTPCQECGEDRARYCSQHCATGD